MKLFILIASILFTANAYAQFVDVNYPFIDGEVKKVNVGVGKKLPTKSPIAQWVRGRLDYSFFRRKDLSIYALNPSIGVGRAWLLNTKLPQEIQPALVLGYSQPLFGPKETGGMFYGAEIDYLMGKRISFPVGFLQHHYNNDTYVIVLLGVRMRPFGD